MNHFTKLRSYRPLSVWLSLAEIEKLDAISNITECSRDSIFKMAILRYLQMLDARDGDRNKSKEL